MSVTDAQAAAGNPAWERYREAEREARTRYLAAVAAAQEQFDADTHPARKAYSNAERAAWMAYYAAGRDAWRRYNDALGIGNMPYPWDDEQPIPPSQVIPSDRPVAQFHPTHPDRTYPEGR